MENGPPENNSPQPQLIEQLFRIPFGIAIACYVLSFSLVSLSIGEGYGMVHLLLLLVLSGCFYLSMVDQWWNLDRLDFRTLRLVIAGAIIVRLGMMVAPLNFSDDIYRYIWEGRVIVAGFNPYQFAPNAPELAALRDDVIWPAINHPEISAIYPPLAQALFALIGFVGGGVILTKALWIAVDLLIARILWLWLARAKLPRGRILVWLLHPLVVVEFSSSGHLDILVVLGLVLTMFFLECSSAGDGENDSVPTWRNAWGATGGLALAALSKIAPVVFIPHLARQLGARRSFIVLSVPALLALSYVPFFSAGDGVFRAVDQYESRWRHNDSVFRLVFNTVESVDPDGQIFTQSADAIGSVVGVESLSRQLIQRRADSVPSSPHQVSARLITYALFGIVWIVAFIPKNWPWDRRWLLLMGGAMLLSPVNHPWYLTLLIPCCMRRFEPLALWWTLTVLATYLPLDRWEAEHVWQESNFAWWLQYGGIMAIAAIQIALWGRRKLTPSA